MACLVLTFVLRLLAMKLIKKFGLSMFSIATDASDGIIGDILMICSALSFIAETKTLISFSSLISGSLIP